MSTSVTLTGHLIDDSISAQGLAGCVIDGCGKPLVARGRCRAHYQVWWKATDGTERPPALNLKRKTPAERFAGKVDKRGPDECWPWKPPKHRSGHGEFFVSPERGKVRAHSFALELATGVPCPPGREACHRCDNPPCCNPAHIYYGTRQDNVNDMVQHGRALLGTAHPNAKLTETQVLEMRQRRAAGTPQRQLAADYGVSAAYVSTIVNGLVWSHVGGPITGTSKRTSRRKAP